MSILEESRCVRNIPFIEAIFPYILRARAILKNQISSDEYHQLTLQAHESLETNLLYLLSEICAPSMAIEMHIAKLTTPFLGNTSEDRYEFFIRKFLTSQSIQNFFAEYKTLPITIEKTLLCWVNNTAEFLKRLAQDKEELTVYFSSNERPLGQVISITTALSDRHNSGQTVCRVLFENGIEILYKPKKILAELAMNQLFLKLNHTGHCIDLPVFRVLDKKKYGWVEKIEHKECTSLDEVGNFFERSGVILCIFYLLYGTDIHSSNLIASGAYPTVIDFETLFQPYLTQMLPKKHQEEWEHTVLSTGLLPNFLLGEKNKKGIDMSGLFADRNQIFPFQEPEWVNINTDEMRRINREVSFVGQCNQVRFLGNFISPIGYINAIISGFQQMYQFARTNYDWFFSKESPIYNLSCSPMRCIFRPTLFYSKLANRLLDPELVRNPELADEELAILKDLVLNKEIDQKISPIFEEEKNALKNLDIPYFYFYPHKTNLYTSRGLLIKDFFNTPPFTLVVRRFENLDQANMDQQTALIRDSFKVLEAKNGIHDAYQAQKFNILRANSSKIEDREPLRGAAKKLAIEIGTRILDVAFDDKERGLSWLGPEPLPMQNQYVLRHLSDQLYSGRAGIALFFSTLFAVTKNVKWKHAAERSIVGIKNLLKRKDLGSLPITLGIGGMGGLSGISYSLAHCSSLLGNKEIMLDAINLLSLIKRDDITHDERLDIIGGSAGLILCYLAFYNKTQNPCFINSAELCGHNLLNRAKMNKNGMPFWRTENELPLLGFAHGSIGIAYALSKLSNVSEVMEFQRTADLILTPSLIQCSFLDHSNLSRPVNLSWCHGITGMGLSLLEKRDSNTQDAKFYNLLNALFEQADKLVESSALHLCCGIAGYLELLHAAKPLVLKGYIKAPLVESFSYALIETLQSKHDETMITPGFMQGSSGIGYTLLRLFMPELQLPCILLLE